MADLPKLAGHKEIQHGRPAYLQLATLQRCPLPTFSSADLLSRWSSPLAKLLPFPDFHVHARSCTVRQ